MESDRSGFFYIDYENLRIMPEWHVHKVEEAKKIGRHCISP